MPTYSLVTVSFILVQTISSMLLFFLLIIILKSKPYFTKWTLFQACLSSFICGLTSLPLVLIYGDEIESRALETPLCLILQKVSLFFTYPLEYFSCTLAIYLWYALVKQDLEVEKRSLKYVSCTIWTFTIVFNAIIIDSSSKEEHWGILPGPLTCKLSNNSISIYGYVVSTSIMDFIAVVLSFHSMMISRRRQLQFSSIQNRKTAIKLGEAVRLSTWCLAIVVLSTVTLVPRAIQSDSPIHKYINMTKFASFAAAFEGAILFLIFGTNRKAALFLPCYYVPPEKVRMPQYSFPDESIDHLNDELSQMDNAYLRQNLYDINSSNTLVNNSSESYSTTNEEYNSIGSIGCSRERTSVRGYI